MIQFDVNILNDKRPHIIAESVNMQMAFETEFWL